MRADRRRTVWGGVYCSIASEGEGGGRRGEGPSVWGRERERQRDEGGKERGAVLFGREAGRSQKGRRSVAVLDGRRDRLDDEKPTTKTSTRLLRET